MLSEELLKQAAEELAFALIKGFRSPNNINISSQKNLSVKCSSFCPMFNPIQR